MLIKIRHAFALLAVVSTGLLAAGLTLGEIFSLAPCHLCNFQRLLYMLIAFVALCGAFAPGARRLWSALLVLIAAGGVAAAAQQSWMQYAPQQSIECGFGDPTPVEQIVNWLAERWPSMFMVLGKCSNKEWEFLGLSLANWSGVCFFLLFVAAIALFLRKE